MLYVLCIVLLCWVIAPMVLLLATCLFWSWYFTWKYEFVFIITRTFESGGMFWYRIYRYSMTGLMAGTITFMAYMGIKEGISQGPLLLPLPFIIFICWRHTEKRFRNASMNLAFGTALQKEKPFSIDNNSTSSNYSSRNNSSDLAILETNPLSNFAATHWNPAESERNDAEEAQAVDNSNSSNPAESSKSVLPVSHVSSTFRDDFMTQPNLLCPTRLYPYPYRLYNIPLLDHYGALSEVYLEEIPEGVDPATIFPPNAIPSYAHSLSAPRNESDMGTAEEGNGVAVNASSSGVGSGRIGGSSWKAAATTSMLMTPLSPSAGTGRSNLTALYAPLNSMSIDSSGKGSMGGFGDMDDETDELIHHL